MNGRIAAVMGLGKSGTSAARALAASGAEVWAWDDNATQRAKGAAEGLTIVDLAGADLSRLALMLWSPGIPHTHPKPHPVAVAARAAGVPLVCDVELLARAQPKARFIGVTGTNGKSTTTTLIAHILQAAGCKVAAGGNLGTPALDLPRLGAEDIYVLELSSYQLELLDRARFDVGVLLNITPDHLGRHGGMEGYVAAKASLFRHLKQDGVAIVGVDDEPSRHILAALEGRRRPISAEGKVAGGVFAAKDRLVDATDGGDRAVAEVSQWPALPGRHNWQNACAAYAAARAMGLDPAVIARALASYPGLAHRQELIAVIDGIAYVNDSKATNADAVEKAMACYDDIYWILGGQPKEGGIVSLAPLFGRVRRAFLIGEATDQFARTLDGKVAFERSGTLEVAVAAARRAALADKTRGAVVLLSPASASWDQFRDFEHRGDVFRGLVTALPGERTTA